ncbi:MAG: hypothetical protein ACOCVF_03695, partial [bacterium]
KTMIEFDYVRARGTWGSYELFAELNSIMLILLFAFQNYKKIFSRYIFIALVLFFISVLVLTGTRGGFLLFFVGFFLYNIVKMAFEKRRLRNIFIFTILSLAIAFVVYKSAGIGNSENIFDRLSSESSRIDSYGYLKIPGNRQFWFLYFDMFAKYNKVQMLTGISLASPGLIENIIQPHSLYIYLIYAFGYLGLFMFLLLVSTIGIKIFYSFFKVPSTDVKIFLVSFLIILLIFAADQYKVSMLRYEGYAQLIFILLAFFYRLNEDLYKIEMDKKN